MGQPSLRNRAARPALLLTILVSAVLTAVGAIALGSPTESSLGAEKEARLGIDAPSMDPGDAASAKAAYLENNQSPDTSTSTESPDDQHTVTGITDTGQGPFSPELFSMENEWQDVADATLTQVWAGAYTSEPSQGVVLVRQLNGWPSPTIEDLIQNTYDAPLGAGSLRIESVASGTAILLASSGNEYSFDIATGTFELVPTPSASA